MIQSTVLPDTSIQTAAAVRRFNRKNVLTEIYHRTLVSRTGLVASTGLTGTGISRITRELIEAGLVEEGSRLPRRGLPGRRETELSISGDVAHVVAVSLHVDSRSIVLADVLGVVKDRVNLDIPFTEAQDRIIGRIGDLVLELIERNNLKKAQVIGIALSLAGRIKPLEGILVESRIYQWKDLPVVELLQSRVGIPVAIENLNNVINLAEAHFGQSQGYDNVLAVRVGTGYVGASLMLDGRLVRGRWSAAGLIHHVPVNANQILCECGLRGCMNTVSSGFGILVRMKNRKRVRFTPGDPPDSNEQVVAILESAEQGDPRPRRLLREGGEVLGLYIAQLAEAVSPEAVVIAGKVGRSPCYMEGFNGAWNRFASQENRSSVRIVRSFKTVAEATVDFAIDRFLLSMEIDLEPLKRIHSSAKEHAA